LGVSWLLTFGDSVILRHINPHSVGLILLNSCSVGVGVGVGSVLGSILGYIVWVVDSDGLVLSLHFGLGDIVGIGLDVDIGDLVGQGVLLGFSFGDVYSLGFCEVLLSSVVAILSFLVVVMLSDVLGVIEQLSFSLNLRF